MFTKVLSHISTPNYITKYAICTHKTTRASYQRISDVDIIIFYTISK